MAIAQIPTLDEALDLVRRLAPSERAELVAQVVRELVGTLSEERRRLTPDQAREALAALRTDIAALPYPRQTLGEQVEADRRERERALSLRETDEAYDAHT